MKNVVVITADSVRADHLGLYGYPRSTTPRMSEISNRAVFKNAWANAPYTPASMPSLFASQYLLEDGHLALRDHSTVQDHLENSETRTCLVNSNIQLDRFGCTDGWDNVIDFSLIDSNNRHSSQKTIIKNIASQILSHNRTPKQISAIINDLYHKFAGPAQPHPQDSRLIAAGKEWLDGQDSPFYLHLHLMNTHHPYYFSPGTFEKVSDFSFDENRYARLLQRALTHVKDGEFVWSLDQNQRQYIVDAYDASIRELDSLIADFISDIDLSETSVVFTSDHGEELWDHGHFGHTGYIEKPRQTTLYEEVLNIPMVIFENDYRKEVVETPVTLLDIAPTIVDITAGESICHEFRGKSLNKISGSSDNLSRPVLAQATSPGEPTHYAQYQDRHRLTAVKIRKKKLINNERSGDKFYNLSTDSSECENVICNSSPSQKHRELANKYLSSNSSTETMGEHSLDRGTEETLKDLGYL